MKYSLVFVESILVLAGDDQVVLDHFLGVVGYHGLHDDHSTVVTAMLLHRSNRKHMSIGIVDNIRT